MHFTMRVLLAGTFALLLAACSSSSSSDSGLKQDLREAQDDLATTQTDLEKAQTDLEKAQTDLEKAQADLDEVEAAPPLPATIPELQAAIVTAQTKLDADQDALDTATLDLMMAMEAVTLTQGAVGDATTPDDLAVANMALQGALAAQTDATTVVEGATTAVTNATDDLTTAQANLYAADPSREVDAGEKADAAHVKMATRVYKAVKAAPLTSGSENNPVTYKSVKDDGAVKVTGYAPQGMSPASITDWAGHMLQNDGDVTGTHHVLAYTNIDPAKEQPFTSVHNTKRPAAVLDTFRMEQPNTAAPAVADAALEWKNAKTAGGKTVDTDRATFNAAPDFAGTYLDHAGVFRNTSGTWTFELADTKALITVKDSDYLYFGWWKMVPVISKNDIVFEPFAGGSIGWVAPAVPANVEGTATYKGPAAGLYATQDLLGETSDYGKFTASAQVEANFAADATVRGVSGTIGRFQAEDGTPMSWVITLPRIPLWNAAGTVNNLADHIIGFDPFETKSPYAIDGNGDGDLLDVVDSVGVSGYDDKAANFDGNQGHVSWEVSLHGKPRRSDNHPTGIAGTFEAGIESDMQISGGFAATNVKAD